MSKMSEIAADVAEARRLVSQEQITEEDMPSAMTAAERKRNQVDRDRKAGVAHFHVRIPDTVEARAKVRAFSENMVNNHLENKLK